MSMTDAELLESMNRRLAPTGNLLGQRMLEVRAEEGFVAIEFEARPEFCNPMGTVQGGFVAAMLDDAAAIAAIVKARRRIAMPTLEFKVTFYAAARPGKLRAEGRCIRLGRTIAFMESKLFDSSGKLLASMTTTAMPMEAAQTPHLVEAIRD